MIRNTVIRIIAGALFVTAAGLAAPARFDASESSSVEVERFLREARIVQRGPKVAGEEHAYFATLSDGRTIRTAFVQTLTPYRQFWYESRSSFRYNVAAYTLDRLIGAGITPCTVFREIFGRWASVTLWSGRDGRIVGWRDDAPRAAVFRALIGAPQGSFAGGFSLTKELMGLDGQPNVDERFRTALESLSRKQLKEQLGSLLSDREIRFLLCRRDRILARCQAQDGVTSRNGKNRTFSRPPY